MTDSDTTRSPNPPSGGTGAAGDEPGAPSGGAGAPVPPSMGSEPPAQQSGGSEPPAQQSGGSEPPASPQPPQAPPASAWRPPPSDSGRNASLFFGAVLLIIGAWFFATRTLGLDLPDLDWGQLWPLILIVIGAWIVFGALRQRSR